MKHTNIITFNQEEGGVIYEGAIPNVVVGQIFCYDHTVMSKGIRGRVVNIQHAIDILGNVNTYIDVES